MPTQSCPHCQQTAPAVRKATICPHLPPVVRKVAPLFASHPHCRQTAPPFAKRHSVSIPRKLSANRASVCNPRQLFRKTARAVCKAILCQHSPQIISEPPQLLAKPPAPFAKRGTVGGRERGVMQTGARDWEQNVGCRNWERLEYFVCVYKNRYFATLNMTLG